MRTPCATAVSAVADGEGLRSPACYRRAVTLAEITIVLIIIGLLGAIALPRFANVANRHRLEAAVDRVKHDVAYAQVYARTTSTSVTVSLDAANDQYELVGVTGLEGSDQSFVVDLSEEPYRADLITAKFGGDAELVFDGYGVPDSGGSLILNVGGHYKLILVDQDSGRVQAQ